MEPTTLMQSGQYLQGAVSCSQHHRSGSLFGRHEGLYARAIVGYIKIAQGRILVDGFHRWQAHKREGKATIEAIDLGPLSDSEIFKQAIKLNCEHGYQLEEKDKQRHAQSFWGKLAHLSDTERYEELCELFSVSRSTIERWTKVERQKEKEEKETKAWEIWLDCWSERAIGEEIGVAHETVSNWLAKKRQMPEFSQPPASLQHFDIWDFAKLDPTAGSAIFGRMPAQIVENLLWLYTDVGSIIVDPFAGSGTTIDVAKRVGRRVWASDLTPFTPNLPNCTISSSATLTNSPIKPGLSF
jgi:hypothetical protein